MPTSRNGEYEKKPRLPRREWNMSPAAWATDAKWNWPEIGIPIHGEPGKS